MKKNAWPILAIVVLVLQFAAEAFLAVMVLRMNMLPELYAAILIGVLLVLLLLTSLMLLVKSGKHVLGIVRRVIGVLLALLVICGCLIASKLAVDAYKAIHSVTNTPTITDTRSMYIFVRADDPAEALSDAADYRFAVIEDYDWDHTQAAIAYVETAVGNTIAVTEYASATEVADALFAEQADAVIFNSVSIALLEEMENYTDFTSRVKILQQIPLSELELPEEPTLPAETEPPVKSVTNSAFVVYVSGTDTRSSITSASRSDVNILMVVNPVTKQVLLINTPRDCWIANPAGNGRMDKLTHCGLYGTECSMKALGDLYGLDIDYFGRINFTGFETLVDAIGGITVFSDEAFTVLGKYYYQYGENYLDGESALHFARDRYHVNGGDHGRGKNQMKVIKAVIEKMTTGTTIIAGYSEILRSLEGMFSTSMTMDDISTLVKMQLADMAKWNVQSIALGGVGGSEKTYSMPGSYAYVMYPDESQIAYISALAQQVIDGEILTEESLTFPE